MSLPRNSKIFPEFYGRSNQGQGDCIPFEILFFQIVRLYFLCNILSYERMDLSFTIAAGPRQGSHSRVRVPRNS
jgi:hypothetical protein